MSLSLALVALLAAAAHADVIALTPDNFADTVDGSSNVLVEFYAPWCGHCKNLAPEYEVVGSTFRSGDGVVIAKVDAEANRELAQEYGVSGYPTLKWFPRGSTEAEDFGGGRTADSIVEWINGRAGTARKVKKAPTAVTELTPANFDAVVHAEDAHVLVEFFAPWCGHCKQLAPKYEKAAAAFAGEDNVVVAAVDADKHKDLAGRFDVTGFPTLKFFGAGEDEPEPYQGGRETEAIVDFLNGKAGTFRTADGGLTAEAGRVAALDALAAQPVTEALLAEAEAALAALDGDEAATGKHYVKAMRKILDKGAGYVDSEIDRLSGMLDGGNVSPAKRTLFQVRRNVLRAFKEAAPEQDL